jgi:hypothetical protein
MDLLLELNDWLARHDRDANPEVSGSGKMSAGVGIYYFEEQGLTAGVQDSHDKEARDEA